MQTALFGLQVFGIISSVDPMRVLLQEPKERKLSKVQAAKQLRSGSKSKST